MAPLLLEVPWDADWTTSDYNCISRNVNACLQRLELHRRATHATLCRLQREQRWNMGRGGTVAVVAGLWEPHFTATWPWVKVRSSEAFPAGGGAPR